MALGCRASAIIYQNTRVYGDYQLIIAINASTRQLTVEPNATSSPHPMNHPRGGSGKPIFLQIIWTIMMGERVQKGCTIDVQKLLFCQGCPGVVHNCIIFLCSLDVGNRWSIQRSQYKEGNSSSWETNWSRGVQGLTRVPPSSRIPTLATAVANFKFPSADQNEHETVQLVLYWEARGLKNMCGRRIIEG